MAKNNEITRCSGLENFLKNVVGLNNVCVQRKNFTWMVSYKNVEGKLSLVYWQLSLKDPWWIPHYDDGTCGKREGQLPLCGWLFFYFGKNTEPLAEV